MKKNSLTFASIVETRKMEPGVWNPHHYKAERTGASLADFAVVQRIENHKQDISTCPFAPIEYRAIPKGGALTFHLENNSIGQGRYSVVEEQTLLFGTMRAYLGNVLVTPKSEWIGYHSPLHYAINSEFAQIMPHDGLVYFWWAYLKSPHFLLQMPTGSGGTRPRISPADLAQMPVNVPPIEERSDTDQLLFGLARQAWASLTKCNQILSNNVAKK